MTGPVTLKDLVEKKWSLTDWLFKMESLEAFSPGPRMVYALFVLEIADISTLDTGLMSDICNLIKKAAMKAFKLQKNLAKLQTSVKSSTFYFLGRLVLSYE